jgi:carboxylesterase
MTEFQFIKNPHLAGDTFILQGSDTGILLLHGFTATTAEVRPLAECLHRAGFTISAPLLPGHGTHPGKLNTVKWMDWYETAEAAFLNLHETCRHVFVGGESMGGLLALLLAGRVDRIAGIMLFAPAIKIPGAWRAHLVKPFMPWLKKFAPDDGLPWKGYNVYPIKGAIEMLNLQKVVRRELEQVKQPAIIFTGKRDTTISPDCGQLILDGISSTQKSLHLMPDSPHCILLDHEVGEVCRMCQSFINKVR